MSEEQEGLSSLDRHGHKLDIIPAEVRGFFRKRRTLVQYVLIFIFLILPWTQINGNQTILLDIVNRKFSFLGVLFWSHDGPLIFFILAISTLGLALVTAIWGRVWCGWGCPQTVFIDAIYRRIEEFVEGNYIERRKLRDQKMDFRKTRLWITKWFLFTVVSSLIAHSFIAYFSGSDKLLLMIKEGPIQNWNYFLLVTVMTLILLFDFGWFREQFCIVMCPYGRFQSVLLDQKSITVLYDEKRGEPRKAGGDCVACNRCVQVCPTGIDIRKGVQLECIACTACIDACDEIMTKVKKPTGLIRYASLNGDKAQFFRPRVMIYTVLIALAFAGLVNGLGNRSGAMITLLRAIETPYQLLQNGDSKKVINHFKLHIHNQLNVEQTFSLLEPITWKEESVSLTTPLKEIKVPASTDQVIHFFVVFPLEILNEKGQKSYELTISGGNENYQKTLFLVGPENGRN